MKREELSELGLAADTVDAVMALYGRDVEKHKAAARTWQEKHETDTAALQGQLDALRYDTAAQQAVAGLHFTSGSAKTAFCDALHKAALVPENGALAGFADFEKAYREKDPAAFAPAAAAKTPMLVQPASDAGAVTAASGALRTAFGL